MIEMRYAEIKAQIEC